MTFMTDECATTRRGAASFNVLGAISLWLAAARERRALARLGWSRLEDIGVDGAHADREASRPFWAVRPRD
ncbi:MAG: hypothetical protein WD969_07435 [Paracoccaceae bacterium]